MDKNTIMFDAFKTQKTNKQILEEVYCALQDKDYNPIDQLVGYLISGDLLLYHQLSQCENSDQGRGSR